MADLQTYHNIMELFAQLGLPNDEKNIAQFIQMHRPLTSDLNIWEAPWWTQAQAAFIREALEENAGWQVAVDELNTLLRKPS